MPSEGYQMLDLGRKVKEGRDMGYRISEEGKLLGEAKDLRGERANNEKRRGYRAMRSM